MPAIPFPHETMTWVPLSASERHSDYVCCVMSDVLDHATSEIAGGSKLGIDAAKKLPGDSFQRPWPPMIEMDAAVKAKAEQLFNP